ncbi:glycosyltransferase family 9 protein [Zavarzinella formosa]|uniref:glycosyltransferase family 9 protein n=1 Tax=Zavarzinella formosa TaxID=360055 RepID=UPI0002D655DF|nr:glycosyltransferase family 9 protein [Zavarzinella formosa]
MFQRSRIPLAELNPKRVAVIKPSALGDIVHSMPLIGALRDKFPAASITWVINKGYVPLVAGHPAIDGVIPFDRGAMKKGWKRFVRESGMFLKELRRGRFDLVFDLQCLARTGLMCLATGAVRRVGMGTAREGARLAYTDVIEIPEPEKTHAIDQYWKVAEALGVGDLPKRFDVPASPEVRAWAMAQLADLPRPWMAFGVGARWLTKRWPPEHFATLAKQAQARFGGTVFFVGTPDEAPLAEQVFQAIAGPRKNFCGTTSLSQLIGLLAVCDVMVANDTGPLHVAVGLGKQTVAPYTCTVVRRHGPYLQLGGVETTVWCKGSYIRTCDRLECMTDLQPDRLWPVLAQILSTWASHSRSA